MACYSKYLARNGMACSEWSNNKVIPNFVGFPCNFPSEGEGTSRIRAQEEEKGAEGSGAYPHLMALGQASARPGSWPCERRGASPHPLLCMAERTLWEASGCKARGLLHTWEAPPASPGMITMLAEAEEGRGEEQEQEQEEERERLTMWSR